ncbi:M20/M25/M40 family metallo-hydrolase [Alteraurantiacibacter aestuarii]|uniref:M28 family metallopeptidase n=1 Tax=Alteraurantiacibacter aestuarii TaxID=650004 RepID=UPI0031D3FFF8
MHSLLRASIGLALVFTSGAPALAHNATVDAESLERDVRVLADDSMEGREAGTRGHAMAAGYVAGRFAALGLEPGGDNQTYFQNVPLRSYSLAEHGNAVVLSDAEGARPLTMWQDFYMSGSAMKESGSVEGELVFIGYGLDLPGRDDFEGVDLRGKIAVRLSGGPSDLNSEELAHYRSTQRARLSERGAVGVVLLWTPSLEEAYGWESTIEESRHDTSMTWVGTDGTAYSSAPNILASAVLSPEMSRQLLEGQDFDFDDVIAAEASYDGVMPSFALGKTMAIQFASEFAETSSPNVIGMLPGSDPELADEYVVLTAHLDHLGIQPTEEEGDDEIFNGAMDNATGIASMIEVARLLADHPPRRPVLFVALTAEEKGLIGSSYNAANPTVPADQVAVNINLDMPIVTYEFSDLVAFGAERNTAFPNVQAAVEEYGVALSPDPQPEQGFFTRSDQYSYVENGVPAIYLDIGYGNGGEEKQDEFLSNHYHKASDEADLVDFQVLARFAAINYEVARRVANMDERPLWKAGDFFGETFGGLMAAE